MSIPFGTVLYAAVKPIFKIYAIIGLGCFLARRNILSVSTCRDISDAIVTAIMPCLIFNNVVTNLKSSDIKNLGIIFFTGTLLFAIGVSLAASIGFLTKLPKRWLGGLLSVGLFPNISDLPIAYLQTMGKTGTIFSTSEVDKGVAYVIIFLASQVLYQFCFGLYRLISWDFREELRPKDEDDEVNLHSTPSLPIGNRSENAAENENDLSDHISTETKDDQLSLNSASLGSIQSEGDGDDDTHLHPPSASHGLAPVYLYSKDSSSSSRSRTARRRSRGSSGAPMTKLDLISSMSRATELRHLPSQGMTDVINEYSEYEGLRSNELRRTVSVTTDVAAEPVEDDEGKKKTILRRVIQFLRNFLAPNSVSLIVSIAIAMSPPLKALFVKSSFSIKDAPDHQPPLSFIIDIASYIGAASVPLGLLLLGATIYRLEVKKMPPGFWKTAVSVTAARLIILPIIGVGLTTGFYKGGWYGDDKLIRFVSVLEYGLPSATALVYFTAFYTDPNLDDHLQMDCLAVCLIAQYLILFITLPFLVVFTIKVSLDM